MIESDTAGRDAADAPTHTPAPDWSALPVDAVLQRLSVDPATGLDEAEAARRGAEYGPNRMPDTPTRPAWVRLLAQFNNILVYVLLVAAGVTMLLQHWIDAGVILAVVLGNAVIGFIQEGKAEQALAAIRSMLAPRCAVVRGGERRTLAADALVPGDIVLLESGDRVPADLRILDGHDPRIEEAILTGESVASAKSPDPVRSGLALGDRDSMAYSGTLMVSGTARGVVVETGANTEVGRIGAMVGTVRTLTTPLLRTIDRFSLHLSGAILAIGLVMFLFGWLVRDYAFAEIFMAVVGMAVAAIPEGLPAVLTITLALGAGAMARHNAIVRRLPAIETLGSVSVICTDKTGTLTHNEMMAAWLVTTEDAIQVTGDGYAPEGEFHVGSTRVDPTRLPGLSALVQGGVLASDAAVHARDGVWQVDGDPLDGALVVLGRKAGLQDNSLRETMPRVDVIPFESRRRYTASLHEDADRHDTGDSRGRLAIVKGAPDRVLTMAALESTSSGDRPITRRYWEQRLDALANDGHRVIAVARRRLPDHCGPFAESDVEGGLTLLGLIGLEDPPRKEAIAAIQDCQAAGIRVKMITGDHAATAGAVARSLGLRNPDRALTGIELDGMATPEFRHAVASTDVFARTNPENKLRLVQALQEGGAVVAMTGDGVNDSPALKRADIGVAMGRKGSEAAKEASDLVLADDNFATITAAVREGRRVYDNLVKTIQFMLPTNGGEALVLISAVLFGLSMPITPVQILWVNLATAVTLALALAFEPAGETVMTRPPRRPDDPILPARLVWRIAIVSGLFLLGVLGMYHFALMRGADLAQARTVATNALVVFEIAYLFNVRDVAASRHAFRDMVSDRPMLAAVGSVVLLQIAFTYLPAFNWLLETKPLGVLPWFAIVLAGLLIFLCVELIKWAEGRAAGARRDGRKVMRHADL